MPPAQGSGRVQLLAGDQDAGRASEQFKEDRHPVAGDRLDDAGEAAQRPGDNVDRLAGGERQQGLAIGGGALRFTAPDAGHDRAAAGRGL